MQHKQRFRICNNVTPQTVARLNNNKEEIEDNFMNKLKKN
jgi:hypothetical protein